MPKIAKGGFSLIFIFLCLLFLPSISYGANLADNSLIPLMNGETQNLRLEISGMYHKATDSSTYHRRLLRDSEQPRDFLINVENSDEPVTSYLTPHQSEAVPGAMEGWILRGRQYFSTLLEWSIKAKMP
jgi:hypothetical protein